MYRLVTIVALPVLSVLGCRESASPQTGGNPSRIQANTKAYWPDGTVAGHTTQLMVPVREAEPDGELVCLDFELSVASPVCFRVADIEVGERVVP